LPVTGKEVGPKAQPLCVHRDTPGSAAIAERIRIVHTENGFITAPFTLEG